MIRYVNIGAQINEGEDAFAFFDTITNRFIEFDGEQVFESTIDFAFHKNHSLYSRCNGLTPKEKK